MTICTSIWAVTQLKTGNETVSRCERSRCKWSINDWTERLKQKINRNKSFFRIRLGSRGPSKIPSMMITVDSTNEPVRVLVRKCPAEQRKYLEVYFGELLRKGFLKACLQASWQAAPHLVPKVSKAKYRTSLTLRPVITRTKTKQWAVQII